MALQISQTLARYFESPLEFHAERFLKPDDSRSMSDSTETTRELFDPSLSGTEIAWAEGEIFSHFVTQFNRIFELTCAGSP
jgi:hypothetical protein